MAHTGSAQREPSMEEILASIRRIIEDSDAVRAPGDEPVPEEVVASASVSQPVEQNEVAAFRAGLEETGPEERQPEAVAGEAVEEPVAEARPPLQSSAEIHALRVPLEPVSHASPLDLDVVPEPDRVDPPAELPITNDARPGIISAQTGRQVAAAFGELSDAFAANRKRSFDEMAEEMLRPMLQDWLDNNLPTLVERLVREEIERVARGG